MAELKPMEVIMRIDFVASDGEQVCVHAERVRELIRCKDCKYGSPNGKYGCRVYHYRRYETHDMKPDDFCSYAERRSDE